MSSDEQLHEEMSYLAGLDAAIVMCDVDPLAIVPISDRCRALFPQWGMEEGCDGIAPPDDAMDFINSMPMHWLCGMSAPTKERYILQEITLPQPLIVVH